MPRPRLVLGNDPLFNIVDITYICLSEAPPPTAARSHILDLPVSLQIPTSPPSLPCIPPRPLTLILHSHTIT